MNHKYLEEITERLLQAYPNLATAYRLEFKSVFGAVGGYVNGQIFVSCGKFGVALRLPPEVLDELFQDEDVKPLRYFPKGHVKKEYAVLPKPMLDDVSRLRKLLNQSIAFVLSS